MRTCYGVAKVTRSPRQTRQPAPLAVAFSHEKLMTASARSCAAFTRIAVMSVASSPVPGEFGSGQPVNSRGVELAALAAGGEDAL